MVCRQCYTDKDKSEYYTGNRKCKECIKANVRARGRRMIDDIHSYDWYRQRESFTRIFKHRHRNMRQRVEGRRNDRTYTVFGTTIVTQQEFLDWCRSPEVMKVFLRQWIDWRNSGYDRKLVPSIDRIDDKGTYTIGNMRWLPLKENAMLGQSKMIRSKV